MFSEVQPALLTGLVLSHSGSVLEPVGTACVWQGVSSWPLLTEAIPAASPLPNTCHVNSTQYMSCFLIQDVDSIQFYTKSIILNCQRGTCLCFTFCVLQSFDYEVFFFGLSSLKLPSSSAALCSSLSRLSTLESVWVWQKCKVKVPLCLIRSELLTLSAALSKYPGLPIKLLHVWPCCLCFINTPVVTAVCRHCLPHTLNKNDSRWLFITA